MALVPVADTALGPIWAGTHPATLVLGIEDEYGEPIDLADYSLPTIALVGPDTTAVTGAAVAIVSDDVVVDLSAVALVVGVNEITITMTFGGEPVASEPFDFVVQTRDGWLTLARARKDWADAPADDVQLYELLEAAKTACIDYAPALPVDDAGAVIMPLPAGYRNAQLMQARNTWNAAKTDPSVSGDGDMFVIRPYPLDNFIKQLLRPRRAVPVVG